MQLLISHATWLRSMPEARHAPHRSGMIPGYLALGIISHPARDAVLQAQYSAEH
jgi:hypothetical protein